MNLVTKSDSSVESVPKPAIQVCTLREANLADYESVTALQARHELGTKSYDDWAHLWVNNPEYARVKNSWPMGWVLENPSHQIVGYIGNIPLSCEFRGKRLTVASGYSWVVDVEYRSFAMWLMDTYFSYPADIYLNTTVAKQAVPAFSLFGSLKVPVGAWDTRAFVITNFRGVAESALRLRKIPAARFLSYLAAPVLFLLDRVRYKRFPSHTQAELQSVNGFDQRFDTFWLELKNNFPNVLLGNRSLSALNWHFGPELARGNVWIMTQTSGGRLLAYAIFVRRDRTEIGLSRIRLADFQSLDGKDAMLIPMLEYAVKRCRSEGIHMLEVIGYDQEEKRMLALLPHQMLMPSWRYYYLTKDRERDLLLRDAKAWRPYVFDGDATL